MDVPTLTKTKTTEAAVVETPVDEKAPTPVSEKVPSVTDLESSGTDEEEWTYPDGGWRAWGAFRLLLSAIQVLILRRYYNLATLLSSCDATIILRCYYDLAMLL